MSRRFASCARSTTVRRGRGSRRRFERADLVTRDSKGFEPSTVDGQPPQTCSSKAVTRDAGRSLTSYDLAKAYGVTDTDGSQPDCWGYIDRYGIDEQSGR